MMKKERKKKKQRALTLAQPSKWLRCVVRLLFHITANLTSWAQSGPNSTTSNTYSNNFYSREREKYIIGFLLRDSALKVAGTMGAQQAQRLIPKKNRNPITASFDERKPPFILPSRWYYEDDDDNINRGGIYIPMYLYMYVYIYSGVLYRWYDPTTLKNYLIWASSHLLCHVARQPRHNYTAAAVDDLIVRSMISGKRRRAFGIKRAHKTSMRRPAFRALCFQCAGAAVCSENL